MSEIKKIEWKHHATFVVFALLDRALKGYVEGWTIELEKGLEIVKEDTWGNLAGFVGEKLLTVRPLGWNERESIFIYFSSWLGSSWIPKSGTVRNDRLLGIVDLPFEIDYPRYLWSNDSKWRCVPHRRGSIRRSAASKGA